MFGETIEIEYGKYERLVHGIGIRQALAVYEEDTHFLISKLWYKENKHKQVYYLKCEGFIEDRVQRFAVHFGFEFLLLVG